MSKIQALQNVIRAADDRYVAAMELALFVLKAKRLSQACKEEVIALLEESLRAARAPAPLAAPAAAIRH